MKEIIQDKLTEIEKEHGIKILYSCESGSRAWGFPSPDSALLRVEFADAPKALTCE